MKRKNKHSPGREYARRYNARIREGRKPTPADQGARPGVELNPQQLTWMARLMLMLRGQRS